MTEKQTWPDIVLADDYASGTLTRAVDRRTLVRIARGIYTGATDDDPVQVVERNKWRLVAYAFPTGVVADHSAYQGGLTPRGVLYLVHPRRRPVTLPGLHIVPRPGAGAQATDMPFNEPNLWISSRARTLLDCIELDPPRGLDQEEVEVWLERLIRNDGEERLHQLRDEARTLAAPLKRTRAFERLDRMIAATLSTGDVRDVRTPALAARASGQGYDPTRLERFQTLVELLTQTAPAPLPALTEDAPRRVQLPFYEAYFSNYIEGTEFTLDEAANIVFRAEMPQARPEDAHDILGTYEIISDDTEMSITPSNAIELIEILKRRHATLMSARSDRRPGLFKDQANRAGATEFVAPNLVAGTLTRAFDMSGALLDPFQRAVYMMFLVAEVHPFTDGNGRIARIMMNAELHANGQVRIIIPTVFRLNYLAALKGATNTSTFKPLVSVLSFAQRYTARIDFSSREVAERELTATNAFRDPQEAEQAGIRLAMPS